MATKHPIEIGDVFGRWTVIGTIQKRKIPCRCSCGTEYVGDLGVLLLLSRPPCRWATAQEQGYNQTTNRLITYKGRTQCLAAWAREVGIRRVTLAARLNIGKSVEEAFSPVRPQRGKDRLA